VPDNDSPFASRTGHAEVALSVALSSFAALVNGQHCQLHQQVIESRSVILEVLQIAGGKVPAVRCLHEVVVIFQPVTLQELPGPVGDLRSRIPLVHRNTPSSIISYPLSGPSLRRKRARSGPSGKRLDVRS